MKLISILLALLVSFNISAETEVTVITDTEHKTTTEETVTSQKKLKNKILKKMILETAEKAVDLDWDEGARGFVGINSANTNNYNINKMRIENGDVKFMEVQFHGFLKYYPSTDADENLEFYCRIDLEKYEDETEFLSEYAYCIIDDSEELEYEN